MNKYQALQALWESFGWAAYNENTVPDNALEINNNRYITYETATDSIGNYLRLSAALWHRSTSWTTVHAKAEEIANYIENIMPPSLPINNGRMVVRKGTPFAQDVGDEDITIRHTVLLIDVEFLINS